MLSLAEGFFQTKLLSHLHTRFAAVFPLTFCYVSSLLMCQPRAYWLLKQWVLFFSGLAHLNDKNNVYVAVNFLFQLIFVFPLF